jgi:lysophospholipase L1-like esterase
LSAALTRTLVSRTTSSRSRLDLLLSLLDQSVDVVIGKAGCNDAGSGRTPAGNQLIRLDRDRDPIIQVQASAPQLILDPAYRSFDHFAL